MRLTQQGATVQPAAPTITGPTVVRVDEADDLLPKGRTKCFTIRFDGTPRNVALPHGLVGGTQSVSNTGGCRPLTPAERQRWAAYLG